MEMSVRSLRPLLLSLLLLLSPLASSLEEIEFVPDPSGTIEKRQISVKGPVRLICKGVGSSLTWQFEEGLAIPKSAKETVEAEARILDFEVFDESMDGLYTCLRYETSEKKRMRLFFFDDVMPAGFHVCAADQKAQCVHAKSCRASDESNDVSCVCMKDWEGPRCDAAVLRGGEINKLTTGMPLVWIVFSLVVLVGIIVVVKCHNDDEKSELVPTTDPGEMV